MLRSTDFFLGLSTFTKFCPWLYNLRLLLRTWMTKHQATFDTLWQSLMSSLILGYLWQQITSHSLPMHQMWACRLLYLQPPGNGDRICQQSFNLSRTQMHNFRERMLWATRKYRHYLLGTAFTLERDHTNP